MACSELLFPCTNVVNQPNLNISLYCYLCIYLFGACFLFDKRPSLLVPTHCYVLAPHLSLIYFDATSDEPHTHRIYDYMLSMLKVALSALAYSSM
jgi:hypothetical protein